METQNEKQLQTEELTIFQQIALEGEVSALMLNVDNDYEKMYYAFLKLALCEERYLLVYKNEFKKYIDETIVNDLVKYRYMELVPTYLFIQKYIRELKGMLGCDYGSLRTAKYPVEIIKSKFVLAMRELMTYVPTLATAILDGIQGADESELEFLNPVIIALKQCIEEDPMEKHVGYDVKLKLLTTQIDKSPLLNIQLEDEMLQKSMTSDEVVKSCLNNIVGSIINMAKEEAQRIESENTEKMAYIVKKIDKVNGQVVFTKEFETQKQAADYIKGIVKDYPEIAKRFNFSVELVEVY